ncbi:MAG: NAD-dependent epimerase/dehydratase family protein [candidate division Zixibacteria bacterium]|nr:NAD-dependent epimerase/dehydratase family protein [candidate division Zixibacteria bacterium]
MEEVLVTGGAGFIASHVVDTLIDMGKNVIVLDDLSGGFRENINRKATFIKGTILNNKLITSIFENSQISFVFHLAAYAAEGLSHFIKRYNYKNNLIGSINLINAAINHNVKCFVFTSSMAVYGACACPMSEDTIPSPVDSYGIAKLAVEQELRISHDLFDLNYVIFRPHNVYGERQNIGDRYRNVIGIFMNQIMNDEPLTIFGDGTQTRAFTYIKDVAPVIANSIFVKEAYNQTFNIGADRPIPINELAQEVSKAMGVKPKIRYVEEREEVKHAYCSHERISEVLSFKSKYTLSEGLKIMADWAERHGHRKSKRFKHLEIQKNLPDLWVE